jgi:hypothetical protein
MKPKTAKRTGETKRRIVMNPGLLEARREKQAASTPKTSLRSHWKAFVFGLAVLGFSLYQYFTNHITGKELVGCVLISPFCVWAWIRATNFGREVSSDIKGVASRDVFCIGCGKHIEDRSWECGYCDTKNTMRSFLSDCFTCKRPPLSIECPHCSVLNAFGPSADEEHAARVLKSKQSLGSILDQLQKQFEPHEEKVKHRQDEIELVHLDTALEAAKNDWREQRDRRKTPSNPSRLLNKAPFQPQVTEMRI